MAKNRRPISLSLRFSVYARDNHTCQYCGRKPPAVELQLDHVYPVSLGGRDKIDNLLTACRDCNIGKGARDPGLAMPSRPQTRGEAAGDLMADQIHWAAFFPCAALVKAVLLSLIEASDEDGCAAVRPGNFAAIAGMSEPECSRILRGLIAVGAIRKIDEIAGEGVWYAALELHRGELFGSPKAWVLGASGPMPEAPSVAEIYG